MPLPPPQMPYIFVLLAVSLTYNFLVEMEDVITCKHCREKSQATPNTQTIRCHGCKRIINIGTKQGTVPIGTNQQTCQEQTQVTTSTKGLRDLLHQSRKNERNTSPNTDSSSTKRYPSLDLSQPPPRGKRALLCGVSYKNQKKIELKGTIYDVQNMTGLLVEHFGFPRRSICTLTEEETNPQPTRKNIQEALKWLVKDNHAGDSLVFYFSGHGLRQPDFDRDERDGFDESICPVDFVEKGIILDNEINDLIIKPLKTHVRLHAIIDACHSGTVLDLPHVYNKEKQDWEDNSPPSGVYKGTRGGLAIAFSACQDDQLAADTNAFSEKHVALSEKIMAGAKTKKDMAGAMTYTFIRAVKQNPKITYGNLLNSMYKDIEEARTKCLRAHILSKIFRRNLSQEPLLSSSEKFDINVEFGL